MKHLLKKLGIDEETSKKIITGMKTSKLYTTSLERADERYSRLKNQHQDLKDQLEVAVRTIEELRKINNYNDVLKNEISAYKDQMTELKKDYNRQLCSLRLDNALSDKLKDFDIKYHPLLIKAFNKDKLQFIEDGTIAGLDEQYEDLKKQYAELIVVKTPK